MGDPFLFVYGKLRPGSDSDMSRWLSRSADYVDEATFQGRLYRIDDYAGAVASVHAEDRVLGEVYRLREPDTTLRQLDQYEECGPGFVQPTEYVRRMRRVELRGGQAISGWIYLYNRSTDGLVPMSSGDFLAGSGG